MQHWYENTEHSIPLLVEVPQDFFEDDGTNFKINQKIKHMKEFCSFIADQNPDNTKQKAKYTKKPGTNFVEIRMRTIETIGRTFSWNQTF